MAKWDGRYNVEEYIFGTEPNEFITRIQPYLPKSGKALDLATGEGRNGIFLAKNGLDAEGVDISKAGLAKAEKLAKEKDVTFKTRLANIIEMDMPEAYYSVITSVFCHFKEPDRTKVMQKIVNALKPNGLFAGVFYHPDQISYKTGGPKDPNYLGTLSEMQEALLGLRWIIAEHSLRDIKEGNRHIGTSSIIYLLGQKI